jgi:hypothetical protein
MKRILTPLIVFVMFIVWAQGTSRASSQSGRELIGLVDNSEFQYLSGCGCSIWPQSRSQNLRHHYYLLTELGSDIGKIAWMNIDGRVMKLSLLSTTRPSGRERKGSTFTEVYRGGGVTARVNFTVSTPNKPGGEVTKYNIAITVTKGDRSQTVRATGDCGC